MSYRHSQDSETGSFGPLESSVPFSSASKRNSNFNGTESLHSRSPGSLVFEKSGDGNANLFQSVSTAFGAQPTTPHILDSESHVTYHLQESLVSNSGPVSDTGKSSQDEELYSRKSIPCEDSQQHGYEKDTLAFRAKRSETLPLKPPGNPISRSGSMTGLKRSPPLPREKKVSTGPISGKGKLRAGTTPAPLASIDGHSKINRTHSLKSKSSLSEITTPEHSSIATPSEQPSKKDNAPSTALEYTQALTTTSEQLSQGLIQLSSGNDTSIDEAFTVSESNKYQRVDQMKKNLEDTKAQIQEREQAIQKLKTDSLKSAQVAGTLQEQIQKVQEIQQRWQKEEQRLRAEVEMLQANIKTITYAHTELKGELNAATRIVKSLETENKNIESSISNLERRLEDMVASPSSADSENFKVTTQMLRDYIDAMQLAMVANTQNMNAYKTLLKKSQNKPEELLILRIDFRKVLDSYVSMCANISAQNEALEIALAKKESEIKALTLNLASAVHQSSEQANEFGDSGGKYYDRWEKLYEDRNKQFSKLRQSFRVFKHKARENYRPGLERENKALQMQLTKTRDENARLQDQTSKLQELAANWESEYKSLQIRQEQTSQEAAQEIERLNMEMKDYIQEYRDRIPENNPDWWEVSKLQRTVRDVERQLKIYVEAADEQKERLCIYNREYKKLQEQNAAFRFRLDVDEDFEPDLNHGSHRVKRMGKPRYQSEDETAKRKKLVKAFMEKQTHDRAKRKEEQRMIVETGKYDMGKWYPPHLAGRYEADRKKR